jgi:hypothetical protein
MSRQAKNSKKLIERAGGTFIRRTKHTFLYRLPNGVLMSCSSSPSDYRAERKIKAELERKLKVPHPVPHPVRQ